MKSKKIILIIFIATSSLLTIMVCNFIAQRYFFDKFIYQKSTRHGYTPSGIPFSIDKFGTRARDLSILEDNSTSVLGTSTEYTIAVIGDSHVWGQGLTNGQRFATVLEKKLNKIRPTRVYSFGKPGHNALNYQETYASLQNKLFPQLYIVVPVSNDSILSEKDQKSTIYQDCQKQYPQTTPFYFNSDHTPSSESIDEKITNSWESPLDNCVVRQSLSQLPKDNAIYLLDKDYYRDNTSLVYYHQILNDLNKFVISTEVGKYMEKYKKYFDSKVYSHFNVSQLDPHPNALANQMYADILFEEITKNPHWNFKD